MTVWLDTTPQTDLMRANGVTAMGMLTVYNNHSLLLAHEERVPLSDSAVFGPGPNESDTQIWHQIIEQFYSDFDQP